jgi:hypothetical protein
MIAPNQSSIKIPCILNLRFTLWTLYTRTKAHPELSGSGNGELYKFPTTLSRTDYLLSDIIILPEILRGNGCGNGWPGFNSLQGQDIFSFLDRAKTGSEVYLASYPIRTDGIFTRDKAAGA